MFVGWERTFFVWILGCCLFGARFPGRLCKAAIQAEPQCYNACADYFLYVL
jgi:hypothetical protein